MRSNSLVPAVGIVGFLLKKGMSRMAVLCPVAGKPGKRVPSVTVRNLTRDERLPEVEGREWFYCDLPDCDVVYFAADGTTLLKNVLKVRVGAKEKAAPRPVCYCFGHTVESIRDEVARTGHSTVADSIASRVKTGECSCETLNPKGSCCLGEVNKAVKEAFAAVGPQPPSATRIRAADKEQAHDCCAVRTESSPSRTESPRAERAGLWAAGASVLSAFIASACCWLPLLLVAFGASAASVSAAFERVRPLFLGIAPVLLGAGFYIVYVRKEKCGPDGACATPARKVRQFTRGMLWAATAVVLAVTFFPNYIGLLLGRAPAVETGMDGDQTVVLRIKGMTCEACGVQVERELVAVPGVRGASVVYSEKKALVRIDPTSPPKTALLVNAVERAGYRAEADASPKVGP